MLARTYVSSVCVYTHKVTSNIWAHFYKASVLGDRIEI